MSLVDEESAGPQLGGREALQKLARMDHYMEDADPVDEENHREQFSLEQDRQDRFEELDGKVERLEAKMDLLLSHLKVEVPAPVRQPSQAETGEW